jgi:hypothetical protein
MSFACVTSVPSACLSIRCYHDYINNGIFTLLILHLKLWCRWLQRIVSSGRNLPTFRSNLLPPSSGSKSKPSSDCCLLESLWLWICGARRSIETSGTAPRLHDVTYTVSRRTLGSHASSDPICTGGLFGDCGCDPANQCRGYDWLEPSLPSRTLNGVLLIHHKQQLTS